MSSRSNFGQITRQRSGRYQARYEVPTPAGAKRAYVYAPVTFEDPDDAVTWLARQRVAIADGIVKPKALASKETLREYSERWLRTRKSRNGKPLRNSTRELYQGYLDRHVLPALGDRPIAQLDQDEMDRWYDGLDQSHPANAAKVYAFVRGMLNTAVERGLLATNPLKIRGAGQTPPAKRKAVATPAQVDQVAALMPERLALAVHLGAWCQLRIGEVLELRRRNVTPEQIAVEQGVTFVEGQAVVDDPKTPAGVRTIAVPPHLAPAVRAHLLAHTNEGPDGLLFPLRPGEQTHMHRRTLGGYLHRAVVQSTLPDTFSFHALRHSGLTWAGQQGATIAELQTRAGHTTPAMVARYQHATAERDRALAERLSEMTKGGTKRTTRARKADAK